MRNSLKIMAAVLCVSLSGVSGAVLAGSTADDLSRIEAETLLLKAREKKLAVEEQIMVRQAAIASKRAESNRLAHLAQAGDPVILGVEGIGSNLYATLQLDNGSTVDAKIGDVLPNGMKVISISLNEVIVENRRRHRIRLSTGVAAATPYATGYGSSAANLPPLPLPSPRGAAR